MVRGLVRVELVMKGMVLVVVWVGMVEWVVLAGLYRGWNWYWWHLPLWD